MSVLIRYETFCIYCERGGDEKESRDYITYSYLLTTRRQKRKSHHHHSKYGSSKTSMNPSSNNKSSGKSEGKTGKSGADSVLKSSAKGKGKNGKSYSYSSSKSSEGGPESSSANFKSSKSSESSSGDDSSSSRSGSASSGSGSSSKSSGNSGGGSESRSSNLSKSGKDKRDSALGDHSKSGNVSGSLSAGKSSSGSTASVPTDASGPILPINPPQSSSAKSPTDSKSSAKGVGKTGKSGADSDFKSSGKSKGKTGKSYSYSSSKSSKGGHESSSANSKSSKSSESSSGDDSSSSRPGSASSGSGSSSNLSGNSGGGSESTSSNLSKSGKDKRDSALGGHSKSGNVSGSLSAGKSSSGSTASVTTDTSGYIDPPQSSSVKSPTEKSKGKTSYATLSGSKSGKSKLSKGSKSSNGPDISVCPGTDASVTPYELPATAFVYSISGATNDDIGYIAKTVGESIYSEVISAMCTGSSRVMLNMHRVLVTEEGSNMHSVSNIPEDKIADDQSNCETADCYVIEGAMTMTSNSEEDEESLVRSLLTVVKNAIESGALDNVAPGMSVEYIGPDPGVIDTARINDFEEDEPESDNLNANGWSVVVIFGTVGLVLVAVFMIRRRRHQEQSDEWSEVDSVPSSQSLETSSAERAAIVVNEGCFEETNLNKVQKQEALPTIMEADGKESVKDDKSHQGENV